MAIVYPWSMDQIKETAPDIYEQLKVVPLPQVNPSAPVSRVYGYYLAVNSASKVQAEAWKFIQFLTEQPEEFITGTNFVQPVIGWETSAAAKEIPFLDVWAKSYETGRFDDVTPHYSEVQDTITNMVNQVVFDKVAPKEAADTANEAVNRILQN